MMDPTAFTDTYALDSVKMRETADGYLVCQPRIARTGIQLYTGAEVGRPDLEQVRVYRPEAEVMHKDSLKSLAGRPVTIEHPDEPVNSKNWKDLAVGSLGDEVLRDGEFIRVPMILMDASAIEYARSEKRELSVGYTAILQWADGKTPAGEDYDCMQTAIRANHVAITHTARGGDKLRMGDSKEKKEMTTRKIMIDGISVEMEERDTQVVERRISALEAELATAKTALATAQTTAQNDVATARTETANATAAGQTKDAEIATLKQQLADAKTTPEKLDKLVTDRVATVQRAKALLDSVVIDGKSDADIRRQIVNAKLGDVAKEWTDDMVTASFNTLTTATDSGNGLNAVVNILRNNDTGGTDPRSKAYTEYETELSNRWKTAGHRVAS